MYIYTYMYAHVVESLRGLLKGFLGSMFPVWRSC